MLADVVKQREQERIEQLQRERSKYNKPYKRETIIYFDNIYKLGGIQTWIINLSLEYEFSVVYDIGDKNRIEYLESMGIECIKYVGQEIECNTLLTCMWGNPEKIKSNKTVLVVHGDYSKLILNKEDVPKHDEVVCVSKDSAKGWKKYYGEDSRTIYNPVNIFETTKPLIIGCFSRLSKEKGGWRYKLLIDKLKASNKPFLMLIFTDFPFEEKDKRVMFFEPVMNPTGWMSICDYVALLSDTEACPYNVLESMKMGKPMIITKLPILEELGVNESNAKILEFDMSNLDIEDLWNIPIVKNWKEPNSKGWEKYMKKKVFREKYLNEAINQYLEDVDKTKKFLKKIEDSDDIKIVGVTKPTIKVPKKKKSDK